MSAMMDNVKNTVMQAVTNKKFIMIVVLLALFIGLAFWVYTTYVAPKLNPEYKDNKEYINADEGGADDVTTATVYAFYTDWCPHCKKSIIAKDSGWKKIVSKLNELISEIARYDTDRIVLHEKKKKSTRKKGKNLRKVKVVAGKGN